MNDAVDILFFKYRIHKRTVPNISFIKYCRWMYCFLKTGQKVVYDNNLFSGIDQLINGMGPNVTGPS